MKKTLLLLFIGSAILKCSNVDEFNGVPFRQYADFVIDFSSQYTTTNWSANQVLGKENVFPIYDDDSRAWSPATLDGQREYLVLGFDTLQTVHTIEIYETWYPGAIDTVYLRNANTQEWQRVYSKPVILDLPEEARIFTIYMRETTYLIDAIRLAINNPEVNGWNEIDAVAIGGQRENNPD